MFDLNTGIAALRQRIRHYEDRAASFKTDARLLRRAGLWREAQNLTDRANTDRAVARGLHTALAAMRKDKGK